MSLTKRHNWDAMMEAQFGADEPLDNGSALSHYKKVLRDAQRTIKLKFAKGDLVKHRGKTGEVKAFQVFSTADNTLTEYMVEFTSSLSFWAGEEELEAA